MDETIFKSAFVFGEKVYADGCETVVMTVIGFAFYPHDYQVQCAWFNAGSHCTDWFSNSRLTVKEK